MSDLLVEVVRLLNNTSAQGTAQLPQPFMPDRRNVVVNQLWFLSMILSLVAVVMGTFCLQWSSAYRRTNTAVDKSVSPAKALALRQLRFDGLVGWGVLQAPEALLLIVQTSIVLFTVGLIYFLWGISHAAALPTIIVGGPSAALLYLANLMPFLQSIVGVMIPATLHIPQCPFKSPTSWILHIVCVLSNTPWIIPFRKIVPWSWGDTISQRISFWCDDLHGLLTDYLWERHDELCKSVREWWGPQHASYSYSYYLVRGIASAMDILVSKPNAMEVIPSCISVLRQQFRDAKTWEKLFHTKLSRAERALLDGDVSLLSSLGGANQAIPPAYIENLKRDFLSAHFFQYLVSHSQKLRRVLHEHRIELYIRIKNSSHRFAITDNQSADHHSNTSEDSDHRDGPVGSSINCPIAWQEDAQEMSQGENVNTRKLIILIYQSHIDLQVQLLSCAKRLIGTEQFTEEDMLAAAMVVASASVQVGTVPSERLSGHSAEAQDKPLLTEKQLTPASSEDTAQTNGVTEPVDVADHGADPPVTDTGLTGSNIQNLGKNETDGDPPSEESLTELCQYVRDRLSQLSPTTFKNFFIFFTIRRVLGLDLYLPPLVESRSSGSDESV